MKKFKDPFTALTTLFPDIGLHTLGKFKREVRSIPAGSQLLLIMFLINNSGLGLSA